MNTKKIITILLSLFVAASVIYLIAKEVGGRGRGEAPAAVLPGGAAKEATDAGIPRKDRLVTVYYFHTTFRCPTCRKIEALTASAVRTNFSDDLAAKRLAWEPVNIELEENRHFIDDFKLFTKSVVIVDTEKGKQVRWKNLDRIWELVRNERSFSTYIKNEVDGFIKGL